VYVGNLASSVTSRDLAVKKLDWSAARGSRWNIPAAAAAARFVASPFSPTVYGQLKARGRTLENLVTNRWLSEACPRTTSEKDDRDRKRLREPTGQ
jgi:hypothetical protein